MTLDQVSQEARSIFDLFQLVFTCCPLSKLETLALNSGVTGAEFELFLAYATKFYTNMGNYLSFGDSKFVPAIPAEKFQAIVFAAPLYQSEDERRRQDLWARISSGANGGSLYSLAPSDLHLG